MKDEKILEIAKFIIKQKATNQEAADYFQVSKSTIQKAINKRLPILSLKVYKDVKEVQNLILKKSQILGGKIGKRGPSITDFEALEIAEQRIEKGFTFEELEKIYHVPSSTIYEALERLDYEDLRNDLERISVINSQQRSRKNQFPKDNELLFEDSFQQRKHK